MCALYIQRVRYASQTWAARFTDTFVYTFRVLSRTLQYVCGDLRPFYLPFRTCARFYAQQHRQITWATRENEWRFRICCLYGASSKSLEYIYIYFIGCAEPICGSIVKTYKDWLVNVRNVVQRLYCELCGCGAECASWFRWLVGCVCSFAKYCWDESAFALLDGIWLFCMSRNLKAHSNSVPYAHCRLFRFAWLCSHLMIGLLCGWAKGVRWFYSTQNVVLLSK